MFAEVEKYLSFFRWSCVEETLDCQDCHLGVLSHVAAYNNVYKAMGDSLIAFFYFWEK